MRALPIIAALAALALAGTANAESNTCKRTLDGGERCTHPDGHVTERRPDGEGGIKTTSTNPRVWGTSDGRGRGVTPPDSMIRNSPILMGAWKGRVTDPWEPRKAPAPAQGGWKTPRSTDFAGH